MFDEPIQDNEPRYPPLPPDVFDAGHGPGRGYLYRPGQLLIAEEDLPLVQDRLDEWKARRADRIGEGEHALVRYRLQDEDLDKVPDIVDELRKPVKSRVPRVSPNHVLFGAGHMLYGPAHRPQETTYRRAAITPQQTDGSGVHVVVVDSGYEPEHPWLTNCIDLPNSEMETVAAPLEWHSGHGTFVAGIVLLHAPGAKVTVRRVKTTDGAADDDELATALRLLLALGPNTIDVLNLSLGGHAHEGPNPIPGTDIPDPEDIDDLIPDGTLPEEALYLPATWGALADLRQYNEGMVVVACAGNGTSDARFYPAAFVDVIAVGSTDDTPALSSFSNFGGWVNCAARGEHVHSSYVVGQMKVDGESTERTFNHWATWSGTSFAAPRVAGAIAARSQNGESAAATMLRLLTPTANRTDIPGAGVFVDSAERVPRELIT